METEKLKENDACPRCNDGVLELALPSEPYCDECLICNKCDSTYHV